MGGTKRRKQLKKLTRRQKAWEAIPAVPGFKFHKPGSNNK